MILTCIVTCDRLPLTKRCIESYLDTKRPGDRLIVVDNASSDGTQDWLIGREVAVIFNNENRYPGAATNQGWDALLYDYPDAPLLHRSDNDIEYLPGWQAEVEAAFADPAVALLGILNLHEDRRVTGLEPEDIGAEEVDAVGGNVVMPARLFLDGLRWGEEPWGIVHYEDSVMSRQARRFGRVARLRRTVANNLAFNGALDFPEYYQRTAALRGITDWQHST